jgi:thiol-disulfide isomerase/thioredoxin
MSALGASRSAGEVFVSPVLVFCAFAVLLLACFLRKKPQLSESQVPLPVVVAILITLGAIVVGALASGGSRRISTPVAAATVSETAPATGHALAPGAQAPKITAAGWVNGPPSARTRSGIRVIDVWAPWCLICRDMAPKLVRVHDRYAPRGVEFISLTDMSKSAVTGFVDYFDIPWSSGYGAPTETIAAFRALREGVLEPEKQISPTLYIVDARGKVLWTDDAGRFRHENVDSLLSQLSAELDEALAASNASTPAVRASGRHTQARSSS